MDFSDSAAPAALDYDDVDAQFYETAAAAAFAGSGGSYAAALEGAAAAGVAAARQASQRRAAHPAAVEGVIASLFHGFGGIKAAAPQPAAAAPFATATAAAPPVVGSGVGGSSGARPPPTTEEAAARVEAHLWGLVRHALEAAVPAHAAAVADVAAASGGVARLAASGAALPADGCASDGLLEQAAAAAHPDAPLARAVVAWLEEAAAGDVALPPGLHQALAMHRRQQQAGGDASSPSSLLPQRVEDMWPATAAAAAPGASPAALDLDAPFRGGQVDGPVVLPTHRKQQAEQAAVLADADAVRDAEVLRAVWALTRAGRRADAQAAAVLAGRPYLAALLEGPHRWQDVVVAVPPEEGGSSTVTLRRGNPQAALFASTAVRSAELLEAHAAAAAAGPFAEAAAVEAALLRVLAVDAGNAAAAAPLLAGSTANSRLLTLTWEDRLWLTARALLVGGGGSNAPSLAARMASLAAQQGAGSGGGSTSDAATARTPRGAAALTLAADASPPVAPSLAALVATLPQALPVQAGSGGAVVGAFAAYPRLVAALLALARAGMSRPTPGSSSGSGSSDAATPTVGGALGAVLRELRVAAGLVPSDDNAPGPYAAAVAATSGGSGGFSLTAADALGRRGGGSDAATAPLRPTLAPLVRFGACFAAFLRRPGTGTAALVGAHAPLSDACDDLTLAYARHLAAATPSVLHVDAVLEAAGVGCASNARAARALTAFVLTLPPHGPLVGGGDGAAAAAVDGSLMAADDGAGTTSELRPRAEFAAAVARRVSSLAASGQPQAAARLVALVDVAVRAAATLLATVAPAAPRLAAASATALPASEADALAALGLPLPGLVAAGTPAAAAVAGSALLPVPPGVGPLGATRLGALQLLREWGDVRARLLPVVASAGGAEGDAATAAADDAAADAAATHLCLANALLRRLVMEAAAAAASTSSTASDAASLLLSVTGASGATDPLATAAWLALGHAATGLPPLVSLEGLLPEGAPADDGDDGGCVPPDAPPPVVEFAFWRLVVAALAAVGGVRAELASAAAMAASAPAAAAGAGGGGLFAAGRAALTSSLLRTGVVGGGGAAHHSHGYLQREVAGRHLAALEAAAQPCWSALVRALTWVGVGAPPAGAPPVTDDAGALLPALAVDVLAPLPQSSVPAPAVCLRGGALSLLAAAAEVAVTPAARVLALAPLQQHQHQQQPQPEWLAAGQAAADRLAWVGAALRGALARCEQQQQLRGANTASLPLGAHDVPALEALLAEVAPVAARLQTLMPPARGAQHR